MKKQNSIFYKIFASTTVVLFLISIVIYGLVLLMFPSAYIHTLEVKNTDLTNKLIAAVEHVNTEKELKILINTFEKTYGISSYVEGMDSQSLLASNDLQDIEPSSLQIYNRKKGKLDIFVDDDKYHYVHDQNIITINDTNYKLNTLFEIPATSELVTPFFLMYPLLATVIIAQSLIIAYFISRITIRPIELISKKATAIKNLDFDNNYVWQSADEFGILSDDLDEMQMKMKQVITYLEDDSYLQNQLMVEEQKQQIAILSHELNTPLTVLKMQSELLLATELDEQKKLYLERNLSKVDEITALVDQILNYKSLDEVHQININQYVKDLIETTYPDVVFKVDERVELVVVGTPVYISRVLSNIVGNAVKYNWGQKPIKIIIEKDRLRVKNNHHPNLMFDKEKLLKPYVRANTDKSITGDGLGLFICKRICMLTGYNFDVEAKNGEFIAAVQVSSSSSTTNITDDTQSLEF